MQHGDIMDLDAPALFQDDVVDAYETPREADDRERQRTENGGELVRVHCSRLVANSIIAEHSQTPVVVADSVVADNRDCPAPQLSDLDRPQHSYSPSLLSPPSPETIDNSPNGLISDSREESIFTKSTRHISPSSKSV
jgi:hypothetical protein